MGAELAIVLGILMLLALCFVVGALIRSRRTGLSFERIEAALLSKVPGYEVLGNVLKGFADDQSRFHPVLVIFTAPGDDCGRRMYQPLDSNLPEGMTNA